MQAVAIEELVVIVHIVADLQIGLVAGGIVVGHPAIGGDRIMVAVMVVEIGQADLGRGIVVEAVVYQAADDAEIGGLVFGLQPRFQVAINRRRALRTEKVRIGAILIGLGQ